METAHCVDAWITKDVLFEHHRYGPGPASATPPHVHDDYQLCLSLDFPGEYRYRGSSHGVPVGAISIIHPGEVHAARDPFDRNTASTFLMMYIAPEQLRAGAGLGGAVTGDSAPFLPNPVLSDATLAARFLRFHQNAARKMFRLEEDERFISILCPLVYRHAIRSSRTDVQRSGGRAVQTIREYLDAHACDDVSLADLADLAQMSPFHLARSFRVHVGIPPHAYAISVRISRAKNMLALGMPSSRVASETGFADQAHFIRHFKRIVGSTPARYVRRHRKIVQD